MVATVCSTRLVAATAAGAPRKIPSQRSSTVETTSLLTWVTRPIWLGGLGVERFTREHRGSDPAGCDSPQDGHRDDRGGDPDADLGEREGGRAVHDHEVARRHQADAAGANGAVDRSDGGARSVHQPLERADERRRVGGSASGSGSFLEVGAGAEGRATVGEDDGSSVGRFCFVQRPVEIGEQSARRARCGCVGSRV